MMNKQEIEKVAFNINAPKVKNIIGKNWLFNFEGRLTTTKVKYPIFYPGSQELEHIIQVSKIRSLIT